MTLQAKLMWIGVAVLGAVSFAVVALTRGEPVNAAWLVVAAVCIYFIAYRFYALFITGKVFGIDPKRLTKILHYDCTPITARFIAGAIGEKVAV